MLNKKAKFEKEIKKWLVAEDNKVLFITGYSGSGKTTLAKEIGEKFNVPVIHLDQLNFEFKEKFGASVYKSWSNLEYSNRVQQVLNEQYSKYPKVIIEGGQVASKLHASFVGKHYVFILKTGFLKSSLRAIKRDFTKENWEVYRKIHPLYHIRKNLMWKNKLQNFTLS